MIDEPPPVPSDLVAGQVEIEIVSNEREMERPDGTLVIDILAPPAPAQCEESAPDPMQNEIVVCRDLGNEHELDDEGPSTDEFGSAIPKAEVQLAENAVASVDGEARPVGNTPANAAMVNVKIKF